MINGLPEHPFVIIVEVEICLCNPTLPPSGVCIGHNTPYCVELSHLGPITFAPSAPIYKFVFRNSYQLKHVDGLTYDFLYNMAKELEEKDAFLFLGAGDKSNAPLVLQRNGTAHRAFMEGRTDGESYMLILHLTNLELKSIMGDENA